MRDAFCGSDFSRDAFALVQHQNKSIATEVAPTRSIRPQGGLLRLRAMTPRVETRRSVGAASAAMLFGMR